MFEGRPGVRITDAMPFWHGVPVNRGDHRYLDNPNGESDGMAVCRCGTESPSLPTNKARKMWHAEHKAAVTQQQ